jgi:hypothetical protein
MCKIRQLKAATYFLVRIRIIRTRTIFSDPHTLAIFAHRWPHRPPVARGWPVVAAGPTAGPWPTAGPTAGPWWPPRKRPAVVAGRGWAWWPVGGRGGRVQSKAGTR